jgi:ABC-type transport system substrate-binding protein
MLGLPVSHDLTKLLYDTIFWSQVKAHPEPWLAAGAEPNEDRSQWTVKLRPGVAWHDGVPFTAEDVKFTFVFGGLGPGECVHLQECLLRTCE